MVNARAKIASDGRDAAASLPTAGAVFGVGVKVILSFVRPFPAERQAFAALHLSGQLELFRVHHLGSSDQLVERAVGLRLDLEILLVLHAVDLDLFLLFRLLGRRRLLPLGLSALGLAAFGRWGRCGRWWSWSHRATVARRFSFDRIGTLESDQVDVGVSRGGGQTELFAMVTPQTDPVTLVQLTRKIEFNQETKKRQ